MTTANYGSMRAADIIARGGVTGGASPTMLDMVRNQISARLDEREALRSSAAEVESTVASRDGGEPTPDELAQIRDLRSQVTAIDVQLNGDGTDDNPGLRARETDLVAQADADRRAQADADRIAAERGLQDDPTPTPVGAARTSDRGSVYQAEPGRSFIADAISSREGGNASARERLARSAAFELDVARRAGQPITRLGEEVRDATTAAFENLVIPQFLLTEAAPLARAGAPLFEALRQLPLPASGMTVNLARTNTGTSAAVQAAEGDVPSETDIDVNEYNVPVVTIAGKQDISRQAVDRGSIVDQLVVADMMSAYYTALDAQLINGSGGSGQHRGLTNVSGINGVTYTDGTPTAAELWPKLADGAQQVASNRFRPLDLWILHPRRWGWLFADTDTGGRPLIVPMPIAQNSIGVGGIPTIGRSGYTLAGAEVLQDASVPTDQGAGTEDSIIGIRTEDSPVFVENGGMPRTLRFDMLTAEEITLAVWGYSAFASGRYPKSICEITGTGLIAPTF